MTSQFELGKCSWCFKYGAHDLVTRNYVRRNVYQCRQCLGRVVRCRLPGCTDMARGHDAYDDERCALHDGLIKDWKSPPASIEMHCSWCFEKTKHRTVERNTIPGRRDACECERCGRRTLACRKCETAMARGHATIDDERCVLCDGTITSWEASQQELKERTSRQGWCSWCFERCDHVLEEKNLVRRNTYTCDNCLGRTLPCFKCDDAMTRGGPGWDDNLCECCFGAVDDWAAARARRDGVTNTPWTIDDIRTQLSRRTEHYQSAMDAGVIRPFLYLVSMDPVMRNQVASQLGWSLYAQKYFGDSHAEAWDILNADAKGIQARTNGAIETLTPFVRSCNWYEILYRTAKEVFKVVDREDLSFAKSIEQCQSSKSPKMAEFENWYTEKLAQLQSKQVAEANQIEIDALMDSEEVRDLAKTMKAAGVAVGALGLRYAVTMTHSALRAGGFQTYVLTVKIAAAMNRSLGTKIVMSQSTKAVARFATALNVFAWVLLVLDVVNVAFGSSHGRAFGPVSQILNQRLLLASEGIRVEDYY